MYPLMKTKVRCGVERLAAERTLIRSLACVNSLMGTKCILAHKLLPTFITSEPWTLMLVHMLIEFGT
jgi:hypothetical protein